MCFKICGKESFSYRARDRKGLFARLWKQREFSLEEAERETFEKRLKRKELPARIRKKALSLRESEKGKVALKEVFNPKSFFDFIKEKANRWKN